MTATLGVLLDSLGVEVVRALALPCGRDISIGTPIIHDPEYAATGLSGAVLLIPGRVSADLVERSAAAGVAAVVMRAGAGDPAPLIAAAERCGLTLLECAAEIAWGQLYTLIDTLRAITGPVAQPEGLRSADLFALANDIALQAGGAVAIEDLSMRVLAYSTIAGQEVDDMRRDGILGRQVPDHPTNAEEYAVVLRSGRPTWSKEDGFLPRLAIAVRDRGEALGSIWIIQGNQPLTAAAGEVLIEGARLAAPLLARSNLAADAERRLRAERLAGLLSGAGPLPEIAEAFGLPMQGPATVLVIGNASADPRARGVSAEAAAAHIGDLLRMGLAAYRCNAAAGAVDGQAVAVVGVESDATVLRLIVATVLARATESLGTGWRAGISRTVGDLAQVSIAWGQARQALEVVSGPFGADEIGRHEELAAPLFLLELHTAMRHRLGHDTEPLSTIVEHDLRHGTDYVTTLRGWIAAHYDIPRAAETLVLHPNTLRHRLRRLAEVIDIEDPDLRLALAVQLRLHDISTKLSG